MSSSLYSKKSARTTFQDYDLISVGINCLTFIFYIFYGQSRLFVVTTRNSLLSAAWSDEIVIRFSHVSSGKIWRHDYNPQRAFCILYARTFILYILCFLKIAPLWGVWTSSRVTPRKVRNSFWYFQFFNFLLPGFDWRINFWDDCW